MPRKQTEGERARAMQTMAATGVRIKAAMERAKENPTSLGRKTGIDRTVIMRLASGERRPNADHLAALASALGCGVSELLPDPSAFPEFRTQPTESTSVQEGGSAPSGKVADALAAYVGRRGDDITPRERRFLEGTRYSLEPGEVVDDSFFDGIVAAFRRRNPRARES